MTDQTATAAAAQKLIFDMAHLQQQQATLLRNAAQQHQDLEAEIDRMARMIEKWMKTRPRDNIAAAVAEQAKVSRLHTGALNSRFVDAIDAANPTADKIYPEPYRPIRSDWALIENRG